MSWCREQLGDCIFAGEGDLRKRLCPEEGGSTCTLVHVILAVHHRPPEIRRRLIAALYPAYGIRPHGEPPPPNRPSKRDDA